MKKLLLLLCLFALSLAPALGEGSHFTVSLPSDLPIYEGPGWAFGASRLVGEDGVYTIVERYEDGEGEVWGQLKSGLGWVNLSAAQTDNEAPFVAALASQRLLETGEYHQYLMAKSEYLTRIVLFPKEEMTNFFLFDAVWADDLLEMDHVYCHFPSFTPDFPLVAGLVFFGDMTTYQVGLADAQGYLRYYTLSLSGKDGRLLVESLY